MKAHGTALHETGASWAAAWVSVVAVLAGLGGCQATRLNHVTCYESDADCLVGELCNQATHQCEVDSRVDAAVRDSRSSDLPATVGIDASRYDAVEDVSVSPIDAAAESGGRMDAANLDVGGGGIDGGIDGANLGVDASTMDASALCGVDSARCAECASSADCTVNNKPICDTAAGSCLACTSDSQCQAKGTDLEVCLSDGHCAGNAETAYVGRTATGSCSDTAVNAGSRESPFCSADRAVASAKPVLIVVGDLADSFNLALLASPLTIIGRGGTVTARPDTDGIRLAAGDLTLRGLTLVGNPLSTRGAGVAIQRTTGSASLVVDACTISGHADGGIFLSGAAFDLRNSRISNNGSGQTAAGVVWSGIRIDKLPASGATSLRLLTLSDNASAGLSCAAAVDGQGILATGNTPNVIASCNVAACSIPSTTCGSQW